MFFSKKYQRQGQARQGGRGNRNQQQEYVLEARGDSASQAMAAASVKFDAGSPAAMKLKDALFVKIKQLW